MTQPDLRAAIVQDAETNRVLMLAYANDEAVRRTRETGEAWFWSRSREELWHKGATSGNTLAVEEIRDDCDGDALLYRVHPNGPACHTGAVADAVSVPVIASGGAGEAHHLAEAFAVGAEAALIASIVHEDPERLPRLKAELKEAGWNVRI